MEIDVVLPCLNESGALPWLLSRMPSGYRPIVADNGSTDGSATIAADHGATVVHVEQRGYGAACHGGLAAAKNEVVCVMDADGSLDPADLPVVSGPVLDGSADLALGRRRPSAGVRIRDIGPMRAARRAALLSLPISDRRFGYPLETVLRAAEAGWRICEADVPYYPRTGKSKVTGSVGGTMRTVRDMRKVLVS
jgi:dTDP-L-rhamnose 4-epimerase